ncbi:MAG: hypothetical protein ACXWUG_01550 [Polyangiales bacterium]
MRVLAVIAVCAVGCGGSTAPQTDDDAGFSLPPDDASLPDTPAGQVAARLLRCAGQESGCHAGGAGGMTLGDGPVHDFAQIVNVRSTERPDLFRVEPGAPDRSWLYLKVSNATDAGVETAMPFGTNGDPAFAAQVRAWILAGAKTEL